MSAFQPTPFPLVGLQAVANARNEWVALLLRLPSEPDAAMAALPAVFGHPGALAAMAPLDCIVPVAAPLRLGRALLGLLPAGRVILSVPAALCADPAVRAHCGWLAGLGYRILLDGAVPGGAEAAGARGHSVDAGLDGWDAAPSGLPGPHLARRVDTPARLLACRAAGIDWAAGDHALHPAPAAAAADDGTSRQRLLALLGLLARDAASCELEALLKQDPALSYQLLKLVNSAAFALSAPIHSFGQAIDLLGRRQLQRWLQLLLFAGAGADRAPHALLPMAAMRAAQMEALCRARGGGPERQDGAFIAGVFSLLDVLLGMPMRDIVGALHLAPEVAAALLERAGPLGALLSLTERADVTAEDLLGADLGPATYWRSLLHGCRWAVNVSRSL